MFSRASDVRTKFAILLFALILPLPALPLSVRALAAQPTQGSTTESTSKSQVDDGFISGSLALASGAVVISEVMFKPAQGAFQWVELRNIGETAVRISGYSLTDEDDHWYRIPDALPPVPATGFVVVMFDGLGPARNEYEMGDKKATLHTPAGLVNPFEANCDQCALYSASSFLRLPLITRSFRPGSAPSRPTTVLSSPPVVDFVAWGCEAPVDEANAVRAGVWIRGAYVSLSRGLGLIPPQDSLASGESIGLVPGPRGGSPDDWALYQVAEVSPGAQNLPNLISWSYPPDGATLDGASFAIEWAPVPGATGYRFRMDDTAAMGSPVVDVTLTEPLYDPVSSVQSGTYFWQVRPLFAARQGQFSPALRVIVIELPALQLSVESAGYKVLGITWQRQRKDTRMLCLGGDSKTGGHAWDAPHNAPGAHGAMNCVRASTSMLASYYGGSLSQDRITYEIFKSGGHAPDGELGHNRGVSLAQADAATTFALGVAMTAAAGKPTFAQLKGWIDANRPLHTITQNHSRVCDGYFEFTIGETTYKMVHILDPWSGPKWVSYADDPVVWMRVGPAGRDGAPNVRSDEDEDADGIADTMDDSDGDGIVDFDEKYRFHGFLANLDYLQADSDSDGQSDKADMSEYLFDMNGDYRRLAADIDGDGDRKETDPDNDDFFNRTSRDGCEDSNHNGIFEPTLGETSNFDGSKERECVLVETTSPLDGTNEPDCVADLEGTITSQFDISGLTVEVTAGTQTNSFEADWTGTKPNFTFEQEAPLFAGRNTVKVTATSTMGPGSDSTVVTCTSNIRDIHVQLSWPLLGSDVDLHLIRPGGAYRASPDDCYYANRTPDWGIPGDNTDNPTLDVDCITQCTVENIVLSRPANGAYQIKVHYFSDHGKGPTRPTVHLWIQGRGYTFGPREIASGDVWDVATIQWPAMTVLSTDQVRAMGEVYSPAKTP